MRRRLEFEGYNAEVAETLDEAYEKHKADPYNIMICEGKLAGTPSSLTEKGLFGNLFPILLSDSPQTRTVKEDHSHLIPKPIDMNYLLASVKNASKDIESLGKKGVPDASKPATAGGNTSSRAPQTRNCHSPGYKRPDDIIGHSGPINHVKALIEKVGPSDARVLITGASGTGKEQVAAWLHEKSNRREGPLVKVNCAAIPSELIESELFGHEKGAFTSAVKQRIGKFELADNGTLFLDEIGDMCASAQAKILRVLQEKKICRVGGNQHFDINVRVLAATNKNLRQEIALGNFREDLYHRLSVIVISMPPLAKRAEDIPLLVEHFIKNICREYGIPVKKMENKALENLTNMEWPGNIRELRNAIERLVILSGNLITANDVREYVSDMV